MKIIPILLGLCIAAPSFAQEIVMVKDRKSDITYALVTSCEAKSQPRYVRVARPEVGEEVYMRTKKNRRLKCRVVKAIAIT